MNPGRREITPVTALTLLSLPFALDAEGPAFEHTLSGSTLVLTGGPGSDLFVDPAAEPGATQAPLDAGRLVGLPPEGDFTLAARVSVGFEATFDAGVLIVYASERRWAKLAFEYSPQGRPAAVTVVTRGTSDDCNAFEVEGNALWLRITRTGRAWAFHASTDGAWWRMLRFFSLGEHESGEPVKVGFIAQSPTGKGCTAEFEHIAFTHSAPVDLRDGS
jgi:regulation of enolase protein 1 (concanavalin A-like superfamily)